MKYFLLYNLDQITKNKLLEGYLNEGYTIMFQDSNIVLVKNADTDKKINEKEYINIIISCIKKYPNLNKRGHVIELTDAFEYLNRKSSSEPNKFSWRFSWYIKNAITHELVKWGDYTQDN